MRGRESYEAAVVDESYVDEWLSRHGSPRTRKPPEAPRARTPASPAVKRPKDDLPEEPEEERPPPAPVRVLMRDGVWMGPGPSPFGPRPAEVPAIVPPPPSEPLVKDLRPEPIPQVVVSKSEPAPAVKPTCTRAKRGAWHRELNARGLCRNCSKPLGEGNVRSKLYCVPCLDQRNGWFRARHAKKA